LFWGIFKRKCGRNCRYRKASKARAKRVKAYRAMRARARKARRGRGRRGRGRRGRGRRGRGCGLMCSYRRGRGHLITRGRRGK
jgi:hypothetical protein